MKEYQRLFRFALIGLSGTILDIGIYNTLISVFNIPFQYAQALSFTAGLLNNYYWNRIWTYSEYRSVPVMNQLPKFTLFSIIGLGIRSAIIVFLYPIALGFSMNNLITLRFLTPSSLAHNFSLGVAIIIVLFWNYISNRLWTFKNKL